MDIKEFEFLGEEEYFSIDFTVGFKDLKEKEEEEKKEAFTALVKHLIEKGYVKETKQERRLNPCRPGVEMPNYTMDFRYDIVLQHKVKE